MKKSTIFLSVVMLVSLVWGIYSSVIARNAIQERDEAQVELTAKMMTPETKEAGYKLWEEDKKKRDRTQEKQNIIFELEDIKKELESAHISTTAIENAIKVLAKEE